MHNAVWCEHLEKRSKITVVDYRCTDRIALLKIQSWYCPECGVHGAETEIIPAIETASNHSMPDVEQAVN